MQQEEEQGGQAKELELFYVWQWEFDLSMIGTGAHFQPVLVVQLPQLKLWGGKLGLMPERVEYSVQPLVSSVILVVVFSQQVLLKLDL